MSDIDQMLTLPDKSSVDESIIPREDIINIELPPWAIRAGARRTIYHDPRNTIAAIVTCGRLCPGINDVSEWDTSSLLDLTEVALLTHLM